MERKFTLDFCPNCLSTQEWDWAEQKCYFCGYHNTEKKHKKIFDWCPLCGGFHWNFKIGSKILYGCEISKNCYEKLIEKS